MQSELERFLPDPFEDFCAMLGNGKAFSLSRFGDGELNAIFGEKGANCDGQQYFPDLGSRLREILERRLGYLMGLQTMVRGAKPILSIS